MKRFAAASLAAAATAWPSAALAGAWTQEAGSGVVINTFTYYALDRGFDEDGDPEDAPRYAKLEYSPYVEYGATDELTVGAQPFFQVVEQDGAGGEADNAGLADVELFARRRVWKGVNQVVSLQGLVSVPGGYDPDADLPLGRGQVDLEGRVLWGGGYEVDGVGVFYNLSAGYRKRFEEPGDEVRLDATFGLKPWVGWQFLIQSFNTIGVDNAETGGGADGRADEGLEFDRHKLQLSVVRDLSETVALQVGGYSEFAGRNVGQGNAGFVALWLNF